MRIAAVTAVSGLVLAVGVLAFTASPFLGAAALALPLVLLIVASPALGCALLLFALPLEELGALSPGGTLTVHKLIGVAVVGAWLLHTLVNQRALRVPPPAIPLLGLVVWAGVSMLWAVDPSVALRGTATLVQLVALYLLLANVLDDPRALRHGLIAHAAGGVTLAALTLYLVGLGVLQSGRAAIVLDEQMFLESNALAAALLLPLTICLVGTEGGLGNRALCALGAGICFAALVLTLSRGALLAAGAMLTIAAVASRRAALPAVALLLAAPALAIVGPHLWERLVEGVTLADRGAGRIDIWEVGWAVIRSHPILGVGLGCFPIIYYDYLTQATGVSWKHVEGLASLAFQRPAHNTYLGATADLGVVGLVLLAAAVVLHLRAALRTYGALRRHGNPAARLLLIAASGLGSLALLAFALDCLSKKYLWVAFALAVVGRAASQARRAPAKPVSIAVARATTPRSRVVALRG